MKEKIVGIIGGMGPEATVDLMTRVIKMTPAADDIDHIRMIVDNNPKIPSRIKALLEGGGENPVFCMQEMGKKLQEYGADFLAIPCNTAHYYQAMIQEAVSIPVLNMIQLTCEKISYIKPKINKIGLLASTAVINLDLYKKQFFSFDIEVLYPEENVQNQIMGLIKKIKTSNYGNEIVDIFQSAVDHLIQSGADALLIACTELSMLTQKVVSEKLVFDSAQVLAESIVSLAKG